MGRARPAAGGGRWVEVPPARLPRWIENFQRRHGAYTVDTESAPVPGGLVVIADDGETATLYPPPGAAGATARPLLAGFLTDAQQPRRLGLVLARKAAAAVGVADGETLTTSKVDSWYVQGRTAAGGQSQQRFARRRGNQATHAAGKATEIVVRLLTPVADELAAVVTGGDRRTIDTVLDDPRLAEIRRRRADRHLEVGTPKLAVLREAVASARAVVIHLVSSADVREPDRRGEERDG